MLRVDPRWNNALVLVLLAGWSSWLQGERVLAQSQRHVLPQREAARYGLYRAWYGQFSRAGLSDRIAGVVFYVPPPPAENAAEQPAAGQTAQEGDNQAENDASEKKGEAENTEAENSTAPESNATEPLMLYIYSEHGRLHAVEAETGRVHWSVQVGDRRLPCERPAVSRRRIAVVHGLRLKLFDRLTGELIWERKLRYTSVVGPAISGDWIMVPSVGGRIVGFHAEDPSRQWYAVADSQIFTQPASVRSKFIWCTVRGNVYVGRYESGKFSAVLPTGAFIPVQPTVWGSTIYVPTHAGFVFALNTRQENLLWRYTAADPIHEPVVATNDSVFVVHLLGTCRCLNRLTGQLRWSTTGVKKILAVSSQRIYALAHNGKVSVLDRQTGSRVGTLPWYPGDLLLTNLYTDRIYAGTQDGYLICVRELQQKEPLVHRRMARQKLQSGPPQNASDQPEKKPSEDPFEF